MKLTHQTVCWRFLWLMLAALLLGACENQPVDIIAVMDSAESPSSPTPQPPTPTTAPTITPSSIPPSLTPTASPTELPTATATAFNVLIRLKSPTPTPTSTPIPTATPAPRLLSIRQPTFEQLQTFLQGNTVSMYDTTTRAVQQTTLPTPEDNSGWVYPFEGTQSYYEDINADGEDDLLLVYADPFLWGPVYLFAMLWEGDRYAQPILVIDGSKLSAGGHYKIANFIGDEQLELIWTTDTSTSGSGYGRSDISHYVMQCTNICRVIWHGPHSTTWNSYSFTREHGKSIFTTSVAKDGLSIEQVDFTFQVPTIITSDFSEDREAMRIEDLTKTTYSWTGSLFTPTETTVVTQADTFDPNAILTASTDSLSATLSTQFIPGENYYTFPRFDCHVMVNELPVSEVFPCNKHYTQLMFHDVLNNGVDELVVTTIFEATQYILVWQKWGEGYREIARISAVTTAPELNDISLANVDNDPHLEIITSSYVGRTDEFCFLNQHGTNSCWFDPNFTQAIYDWDGWKFVRSQ